MGYQLNLSSSRPEGAWCFKFGLDWPRFTLLRLPQVNSVCLWFLLFPTALLFTVAVFCACRALCFCSNSLTVVFTRTPWYTLGLSAEKQHFCISVYFHSSMTYAFIYLFKKNHFNKYIYIYICHNKNHINHSLHMNPYLRQWIYYTLLKNAHIFLRCFKDVVPQPFILFLFFLMHLCVYT